MMLSTEALLPESLNYMLLHPASDTTWPQKKPSKLFPVAFPLHYVFNVLLRRLFRPLHLARLVLLPLPMLLPFSSATSSHDVFVHFSSSLICFSISRNSSVVISVSLANRFFVLNPDTSPWSLNLGSYTCLPAQHNQTLRPLPSPPGATTDPVFVFVFILFELLFSFLSESPCSPWLFPCLPLWD